MTSGLHPQDLNDLYESLSTGERDELLQVLLYAASISGEMVIQRLEERMPKSADQQSVGELLQA